MSQKVLVTLLGRPGKDNNGEYRKTQYCFNDGTKSEETALFGLSLAARLKPEKLVVLGTSGSNWDSLLESQDLNDVCEDERLQLSEDCESQSVTQEQLNKLIPILKGALGYEVCLAIIPKGPSDLEQMQVLEVIAEHIGKHDRVNLDITHSFRHLSMLVLMSAFHLQSSREVVIEGVYYGSFDVDTKQAPVYDLKGLLHITQWVKALSSFDRDNDYGVFAPLLENQGLPEEALENLKQAAFYERTSRDGQARGCLKKFIAVLDAQPLQGLARLFEATLRERFSWIYENKMYQRQRVLAKHYLDSGDYLRCAITSYEAFITLQVDHFGGNNDNYEKRRNAKEMYEREGKSDEYKLLSDLRNALAHGTYSSKGSVQSALSSPEYLQVALKKLIDNLLPH